MIIAVIAVYAGVIILQICLSRMKNKWLGLIFPLIALIFSFVSAFAFDYQPPDISWNFNKKPITISHKESWRLRDEDFFNVFKIDDDLIDIFPGENIVFDENGKNIIYNSRVAVGELKITYDENTEVCKAIVYGVNGEIISQTETRVVVKTIGLAEIWGSTMLLYNIPTAILLVIYAICRKRLKKKRDLKKMSVQDLE